MTRATWVLESDVFPNSHPPLRKAIRDAGHLLVDWNDAWWLEKFPAELHGGHLFFQGSLGNAARIFKELDWTPGSFCDTAAFHCSAWYSAASKWLVHSTWRLLPASEFIAAAVTIAAEIGCKDRVFVRPDSPLKPFSGRVVEVDSVTLASLDYGYYFNDDSLPVVVAPIRNIGREWRFVIVGSSVIAGSAYNALTRSASVDSPSSP